MNPCSICPKVHNLVPPSGPTDSELMFVGEAPGMDEDREMVPFVGKTGLEVNTHYLPLAALRRDLSYFTNTIKCLPDRPQHRLDINRAKDKELADTCATAHLYNEIVRVNPNLIVAMGTFACYAIDPDIDLRLHHGIPLMSRLGYTVFPMWHPAGGIHEPKKMLEIRTDWVRLKQYLKGEYKAPEDQYPEVDYQECNSYEDIQLDTTKPIAADTEWGKSTGPYVVTYSQQPGSARLIRADRKDLLEYFNHHLEQWTGPVVFHNWLADKGPTLEMGLHFPDRLIVDTMVQVYHLGNLPQGLKALAYRELGIVMQDFDDLVTPYSSYKVLEYYREAFEMEWPKPDPVPYLNADGEWKTKQPQGLKTKLKRFFTDYMKNPNKDVFKMFENNWEDQQELMESQCGPYPGKDIAHVPFEEMLGYACRDSDATLRLYLYLQGIRRGQVVRRVPQERWRFYATG